MRLLGLFAAACTIVGFSTATPAAAEPLPYSGMAPEDGFVRSSGSGAQEFVFQSSHTGINASIEVSTSPLLGQNGTLADDFRVDYFGMTQSDAFPGTYRGSSHWDPYGTWWVSNPGTYYWQVAGSCTQFSAEGPCGGSGFHEYAGPVRRIVVQGSSSVPPPASGGGGSGVGSGGGVDLAIYRSEVRRYIRSMIRARTNGKIRKLRSRCRRTSYRAMRCRLRWRIGRYAYAGTGKFFHYAESGQVYWDYKFTGKRKKIAGCARRCSRRLRW